MPLTQLVVLNSKKKETPYKLYDTDGLHLYVHPSGSKLWRFRFRFMGKENTLSFGAFPDISLAEARTQRDAARKLVASGVNPSLQKKLDKIAATTANEITFGALAQEHLAILKANGAAPQTLSKNTWMLEVLAAPLKDRPIADILPAELLDILKKIEKSGRKDTAHRLRSTMGRVFRHAIATLRATNDPTYALRGALQKGKTQHRAAITDERKLGTLLALIDDYDGWPSLKSALQFLVLTMSRPGDVRGMKRTEVDFDKKVWKIPAERMKMRVAHDVPLSRQAIAILKEVWPLNEQHELVFPSLRSHKKPLSENAFNSALRRMGYAKDEATAHGFRSSASTILNERGYSPDVIEAALAHQDPNKVRRIYNRALYWKERRPVSTSSLARRAPIA